ncbi:MAG: hypothetical protein K9J37_21405 [Saprospiraceae bacterium]|nr:hypothetical protein [Saprospiraceae bacterium]MCF8441080.1 hypothetical protein [Saprospiraceae bacterium]
MAWLQASKNPAFQHSEVELFLAWQNGKVVGRVAGIINHLETERLGKPHARFGWLDFVDDKQVSAALLQAVETWARQHNCVKLKGPDGFNSLDKNGMLVEGFDRIGAMTTLYNYEYYPEHLRGLGYKKELEWLEIQAKLPTPFPPKITRAASMIKDRYNLQVKRPKSKMEMIGFGKMVFKMLHETYQHLPVFVPISEEQQAFYIKNYIGLLPPKFLCTVEHETEGPVGFGVTMPNMARAMQKANGKLFPFGFLHLLLAQYSNDSGDLTLIGVKEAWRKKGIHSVIFTELGNTFLNQGYTYFNVNPMLEDNQNVLTLWKEFEHKITKRRRTFYKDLQ